MNAEELIDDYHGGMIMFARIRRYLRPVALFVLTVLAIGAVLDWAIVGARQDQRYFLSWPFGGRFRVRIFDDYGRFWLALSDMGGPQPAHYFSWHWRRGDEPAWIRIYDYGPRETDRAVERGRGVEISIPNWSPMFLFAAWPLFVHIRFVLYALRLRHRINNNLCLTCGYSLAANTSGKCPECGTACAVCQT